MLFLQFQIGQDRYVIDARQVVEVLPLVALKQFPQAPDGVAGAFNYRGTPVPVLDLSRLALGQPAASHTSTRILILAYADGAGVNHLLGLMVEKATHTLTLSADDFQNAGVETPDTPYLGPVHTDARGLIQWVDVRRLLPEPVRELLFTQAAREVA